MGKQKTKVSIEKKMEKVPYCKAILRNMITDEKGAEFTYNSEPIRIFPGVETILKKEVVTHLQNLMIRKSRFEHTPGSTGPGTKIYYEDPRFLIQIIDEFERDEEIKVRKVVE